MSRQEAELRNLLTYKRLGVVKLVSKQCSSHWWTQLKTAARLHLCWSLSADKRVLERSLDWSKRKERGRGEAYGGDTYLPGKTERK